MGEISLKEITIDKELHKRSLVDISRKCLVIGGGGFIGSHVVRHLMVNGIPVRIFDRDDMRIEENLGEVPGVEIVLGDLCNRGEVEVALVGITDVVHLAHTTVPASSMKDLAFDLESNIPPLVSLMQLFREVNSIRRVVYLSSGGTVYGDPKEEQPISEDHPTIPISSYGLTKLIAEHYLRLCIAKSDICGYVLRPSNAYGERQNLRRRQGVIGHFLKALISGSRIVLYGNGSVVRDYIYAGDVAEAIRLCLESGEATPGEVRTFNLGTSQGTSVAELVEMIQRITGRSVSIDWRPERRFDCRYNVLDCSAIRLAFKWQPRVALEEGIELTWAWIQKRGR
jgi:UDP-glucose 4-epimerase